MFKAGSQFVISLLAILTLVLGGCAFAFADSGNDHPPVPNDIFYDETISVGVNFTTDEFVAGNNHDINVYFQNSGAAKENVNLQKKGSLGKWSDLPSFSVSVGDEAYQAYDVTSGKTYRVVISSSTGDKISGYLRVKQTDGTSDSETQVNGVLFDENVSGGANITSEEFTATTSHDINVYFENKGTEAVNVTLQKKGFLGKWSNVENSFAISVKSNDFQALKGSAKTTYRVLLDCSHGSDVNGHLRVRQI